MNGQLKICLTGGIACGKSLLSHYLNEFGVETVDADDIVHELIPDPAERKRLAAEVFADPAKRKALEAKLHPLVKERIEEFLGKGRRKKEEGGRKGRRKREEGRSVVASAFFSCGTEKQEDENSALLPSSHFPLPSSRILHPSSFFLLPSSALPPIAVIPLLFEAHWEKNFDIICCVVSERETQISRMMTTRGYTRAEAEARLAAQMPVAEKAAKSHYVIHNDGTPDQLKEEVRKFLTWLKNLTYLRGR